MTTGTSKRRGLNLKGLLGPALVAGVAYIDPGNIATNLTAGSEYGYLLVWVLVLATVSAALFQFMSAKLGIATGKSLPVLLGDRFRSGRSRFLFWLQAEAVAIATDVAEVLGGAIALNLLTQAPLILCALVVAFISLVIAALRGRGKGQFDTVVIVLMLLTTFGFSYIMLRSSLDWAGVAAGAIPHFAGTPTLLLASSIIGATIMPHAIYAHSSLSRDTLARSTGVVEQNVAKRLLGVRIDVAIAMTLAGIGNLSVLVFSAANLRGISGSIGLPDAAGLLDARIGVGIGLVFVLTMFSSGLASSAVGNYAADEISHGLLSLKVHPFARRLMALVPALLIIAFTQNVTSAIVLSQVVLSFGLPFAIFPLVRLSSNRSLMGEHVNGRVISLLGYVIAVLLSALNIALIAALVLHA